MKNIRISEILDDLNRGLTRTSTSVGYNPELGSIKDKYELTNKELKYLFEHPQLKGKRAKLPVMFNLVDDVTAQESPVDSTELSGEEETTSTSVEDLNFGEPDYVVPQQDREAINEGSIEGNNW